MAGGRTRIETPQVKVSWGELFDKITILRIKVGRLSSPDAVRNAAHELAVLEESTAPLAPLDPALAEAVEALTAVNAALWTIEDDIRDCERARDFGPRFVELARSVYIRNDERAKVKRRINDLLQSEIVEEKSYAAY
jgi:hypothetical protein